MTVHWIRKLLLLTALLVLPLQGLAAAATFFACHEQGSAQTTLQAHQLDDHAGAGQHHHHGQDSDGGPASGFSGHLCGHHVVFHLPVIVNFVTTPGFSEWVAAAAPDYSPHFPEQPRRPPRV